MLGHQVKITESDVTQFCILQESRIAWPLKLKLYDRVIPLLIELIDYIKSNALNSSLEVRNKLSHYCQQLARCYARTDRTQEGLLYYREAKTYETDDKQREMIEKEINKLIAITFSRNQFYSPLLLSNPEFSTVLVRSISKPSQTLLTGNTGVSKNATEAIIIVRAKALLAASNLKKIMSNDLFQLLNTELSQYEYTKNLDGEISFYHQLNALLYSIPRKKDVHVPDELYEAVSEKLADLYFEKFENNLQISNKLPGILDLRMMYVELKKIVGLYKIAVGFVKDDNIEALNIKKTALLDSIYNLREKFYQFIAFLLQYYPENYLSNKDEMKDLLREVLEQVHDYLKQTYTPHHANESGVTKAVLNEVLSLSVADLRENNEVYFKTERMLIIIRGLIDTYATLVDLTDFDQKFIALGRALACCDDLLRLDNAFKDIFIERFNDYSKFIEQARLIREYLISLLSIYSRDNVIKCLQNFKKYFNSLSSESNVSEVRSKIQEFELYLKLSSNNVLSGTETNYYFRKLYLIVAQYFINIADYVSFINYSHLAFIYCISNEERAIVSNIIKGQLEFCLIRAQDADSQLLLTGYINLMNVKVDTRAQSEHETKLAEPVHKITTPAVQIDDPRQPTIPEVNSSTPPSSYLIPVLPENRLHELEQLKASPGTPNLIFAKVNSFIQTLDQNASLKQLAMNTILSKSAGELREYHGKLLYYVAKVIYKHGVDLSHFGSKDQVSHRFLIAIATHNHFYWAHNFLGKMYANQSSPYYNLQAAKAHFENALELTRNLKLHREIIEDIQRGLSKVISEINQAEGSTRSRYRSRDEGEVGGNSKRYRRDDDVQYGRLFNGEAGTQRDSSARDAGKYSHGHDFGRQ